VAKTQEKEREKEKVQKVEAVNAGIAQFESINLETGRHKSGVDRTQNKEEMTYTWSNLSKADTYLFQLFKNGEEFKSMRTQNPQATLRMSEFRGFRRGDELEVRVSNIYGRGKPVFVRTYRATSLATGGQRMMEQKAPVQNPKQVRYEWQKVEEANNYRFILAIQAFNSEEMIEIIDTTINETSFSFVLEHLNKGDQIQTSVEPLQGSTSLQVPEVSVAQYANGIARHDIVLLAMAGSTITRSSLDEILDGATCLNPTRISFEEGIYMTDQGEVTLKGKQYANQIYKIASLKDCLDSTSNFATCLQNATALLPDFPQHNCEHNPTE